MKDLLHIVKVNHTLDYIKQDLYLLKWREFLLLFVELVEQTAIFEVFSDESILVCGDTHAHIQYNIRMFEVTYDL